MLGSITGYFINSHYRRKCQLKSIGYMASYLPVVLLPGFFSLGYHRRVRIWSNFILYNQNNLKSEFSSQAVTSDILLQETKCPVCIEIKSMVSQFVFCVVYPMLLSPVVNYMVSCIFFSTINFTIT